MEEVLRMYGKFKRLGSFGPVSVAVRLSPEATKQLFLLIEEAVRRGKGVSLVLKGLMCGIDISFTSSGKPEIHVSAYGKGRLPRTKQLGVSTRYSRPFELYVPIKHLPTLLLLLQDARELLSAEPTEGATKGRRKAKRGWDLCQTRLI